MKRSKFTITVLTIIVLLIGGICLYNLDASLIKKQYRQKYPVTENISSEPKMEEMTTEQGKQSDSEIFEQAYKTKDWATIEKLGNKGYTKAYYPLALYYFNLGEAVDCKKWSQKAINAGVQTEAAKKLINEIQ